jgi:hypothetical protein
MTSNKRIQRTLVSSLWLFLGGCAAQPGAQPTVDRAVSSSDPVSCDDALAYETADAHPAIRWISPVEGSSASAALTCILQSNADDGTIELKAYMSSGLYSFIRECRPDEMSIYRTFEYKNRARPYLFRLHSNEFIDPKTYIVVSSHQKPAGNYVHSIAETSNDASRIRFCPPDAQHDIAGDAP